MATVQILVDILERITQAYSQEVESLAESCSRGGTGSYEDMDLDSIEEVRSGRELIAEARTVLESLNLGSKPSNDSFDFSSVRTERERLSVLHHNV